MKIALIGAQGVGKTTLCKAICTAFPDSVVVRETVRECPYPCDTGADFKTEWWVLSHSILAEQEAREMKKALTITDRCLLDIAVYTKLIQENSPERLSKKQRDLIEQSILSWFEEDPYDYIFFVKVNPEIWKTRDIDDGFRSVDMGWYKTLTTEFEAAIERLQVARRTQVKVIHNDGAIDQALKLVTDTIYAAKAARPQATL